MAFGANVNIKNIHHKMPLDLCHISEGVHISQNHAEELKGLLREVGAKRALELELHGKTKPTTKVQPFFDVTLHGKETAVECSKTAAADSWVLRLTVQYRELEKALKGGLPVHLSLNLQMKQCPWQYK